MKKTRFGAVAFAVLVPLAWTAPTFGGIFSCPNLLKKIFGFPRSVGEYQWEGAVIPDLGLWKATQRAWGKDISPPGSVLTVADFGRLTSHPSSPDAMTSVFRDGKGFVLKTWDQRTQRMTPNASYEKALLEASDLAGKPHEVLKIRLVGTGSVVTSLETRIVEGSRNGVDSTALYEQDLPTLFARAKARGIAVAGIEITHTHPWIDLIADESGTKALKLFHLSTIFGDMDVARSISAVRYKDYDITVRAATASGTTYSATFHRGVQIDPVPIDI